MATYDESGGMNGTIDRCAVIASALLNVDPPALRRRTAVEVSGGRIVRVCEEHELSAGIPRIDLAKLTIALGLIDCHTHLLARSDSDPMSFGIELLQKSTSYRTLEGVANARATLLAGFTTVRDVESKGTGYSDVALRGAIDAGLVDGPRMQVATAQLPRPAVISRSLYRAITPAFPAAPNSSPASTKRGARRANKCVTAPTSLSSTSTSAFPPRPQGVPRLADTYARRNSCRLRRGAHRGSQSRYN